MFFEKVDLLSPKITLFYKYKKRHSSPIGGFLTSLMVIICILFILKFLIGLFMHTSPTVIFYRKYERDLSKYSFDSSSINHLIWLNNNYNDSFKPIINTKAIRVILLADENNYEANTTNLKNYEHWIYDSCEKEDFKNNEEIILNNEYIKNNNNITNAICIRYYYNKTEKKYYSLNNTNNLNNNYKYPYLENNITNKKNHFLATIIEKCSNNSITNFIFGNCENEEYIQKYLNEHNSAYIQILDHQVDLTNYQTPIKSYFMGMSSFLLHNKGYEVKTINLSPLLIRSNQNIINNGYKEKKTVVVDGTQSTIINNNSNHKILLKYLFCIQNYKQIYERKYEDIFEALSSIGGIIQFFYYVFYLINYFYNDFILILNTQNLFLNDQKNKKISKLIPFNRNITKLDSKNRNSTLFKKFESSNYLNELQNYKFISKENKSFYNEGDLSSIQLSESNNDKDSRFFFNQKKDEEFPLPIVERRSQQLNYNNILKFKLKEEVKKKDGYRNSMFNPKNTVIISPIHRINKGKDFSNLMSSNGDEGINGENKFFETVKNIKNYSKKITLIDNRDRKYANNYMNNNSFADNIKLYHYLKNRKETLKPEKKNSSKKKIQKKEFKKTFIDVSKEKYYSKKLNFKEYLSFSCSIKNKRRDILIIQKFRKKLLSEEHFFKSHLFIYLIIQKIKIDRDDKSDIKELFSEL